MASAKKSAQQVLERLPDDAGWDDIMYEMYELFVKQKVERGQRAAAEGRAVAQSEVRRRLLGDQG